jgi:hypothetical protein
MPPGTSLTRIGNYRRRAEPSGLSLPCSRQSSPTAQPSRSTRDPVDGMLRQVRESMVRPGTFAFREYNPLSVRGRPAESPARPPLCRHDVKLHIASAS